MTSSGDERVDIHVTEMPWMRVATVRHVGPHPEMSKAYTQLDALARPAGLFARPGAVLVGIFHDDPRTTPAAQLRSDAGVTVADDTSLPANGCRPRPSPSFEIYRNTHETASSDALRTELCLPAV